jgi:hypothetical protein
MRVRESLIAGLTVLVAGSAALAQTPKRTAPTEYTGVTTNLATGSGSNLSIRVLNWSTDADRQRVLAVLGSASTEDKAVQDLTRQLADVPSVGQIWTEGAIGYSLKYAHRVKLPDGGEQVVVITDRPLGAIGRSLPWKAEGQADTVQPFTIVQLHLNKSGKGEGKMSLGAAFTPNPGDHTVALTDYAGAPVTVKNVERQPKPYWAAEN